LYTRSELVRLGLLGLLLLLALGVLVYAAVDTVQAARNFQQQYHAVKTGDVKAIHSWMTIRVISHIYQVPEDYLSRSLNLGNSEKARHATLYQIASQKRLPVDQVIHTVQQAILTYRKGHPHMLTPTPMSQHPLRPLSPTPGRS
jgi:hypothetical protein